MGFLSTSGIILLVCVLVGFSLLQRRRQLSTVSTIGAERFAADILESHREQTGQVASMSSVRSASPQSGGFRRFESFDQPQAQPAAGFRYNWGRIALCAVALVALLAALVVGVASFFSNLSPLLALLFLGFAAGCLVTLRLLALRDRDRRRARTALVVTRQKSLATGQQVASRPSAPQPAASKPAGTIPARSQASKSQPARVAQSLPVSHAAKSLRQARTQHAPSYPQLAPAHVGLDSQEQAVTARRQRMDEALPKAHTWEPVEIPRPTYLDAAQAVHPLPPAIVTEQEPLSQTKNLTEAASLNLDDVLKRRRAS